jgi:hypothetical protein
MGNKNLTMIIISAVSVMARSYALAKAAGVYLLNITLTICLKTAPSKKALRTLHSVLHSVSKKAVKYCTANVYKYKLRKAAPQAAFLLFYVYLP